MYLIDADHRNAVKGTIVTHLVHIFLSCISNYCCLDLSESCSCTHDYGCCAVVYFNVLAKLKKSLLGIRTCNRNICRACAINNACPSNKNVIILLLEKRSANLINKSCHISSAGKSSVKLLVNLNTICLHVYRETRTTVKSLTTETLSTTSYLVNIEEGIVGNKELVCITKCEILIFNHIHKEFIALKTVNNSLNNSLLDYSKELATLTVTNISLVKIILAVICSNDCIIYNAVSLIERILTGRLTLIGINSKSYNFINCSHLKSLLSRIKVQRQHSNMYRYQVSKHR